MPLTLLPSPPGRDVRVARGATIAAVAVTGVAFAAVAFALARRAMVRAAPAPPPASERVTFAHVPAPAPASPPRAPAPPPRRLIAPDAVPAFVPAVPSTPAVADTTSSAASSAATGSAVGTTGTGGGAAGGGAGGGAPTGSPVFRGASPLARTRALTPAERERMAWDAGFRAAWLAPMRKPTAAEKDSLARLEARRVASWVEQSRPVPIPLGGAAVPLPGGGPTRAQRKRDSVVHAGNVARLRKIEARVRSDSDSVYVVP